MTDTTSTPTAEQAPENPYAAPSPAAAPRASAANGFSIASLVLGIASIPTGWGFAAVLAIVFGFLARSREPQGRTMSNWGIVLGFVSLFGWVIIAFLGLAFVAPFALWGGLFGWAPDFVHLF